MIKIYHLALLSPGEPNTAIGRAFKEAGEYLELDWQDYKRQYGITGLRAKINWDVNQFKPDLVFMQLQTPGIVDAETADYIKSQGAVVYNWTGDVRRNLDWYVALADHVDLTLFTNMTDVKTLRKLGKKSDYLQIGFDDLIYKPQGATGDYPEIVFLGNNYLGNSLNFPGSRERADMVEYLRKMYGNRFGVYGNGWGSKHLNPMQEAACYRSCKIAINQNHFEYEQFSSDRMLRIMGSGAFCLSKEFPGIHEEYTPGVHIGTWKRLEELKYKIDSYLKEDKKRAVIASKGCELVRNNYTWKQRTEQLIKLYELDKTNKRSQDQKV